MEGKGERDTGEVGKQRERGREERERERDEMR